MLRALLLALLTALPAQAQDRVEVEVDIELFLAVDVSRSMTPYELEIQRRGYAEALSSDVVMQAILGGLTGRIALTYVEWAGSGSQTVVVPWTLIDSADDAKGIADRLTAFFNDGMRRTSLSEVVFYATDSFETNTFQGLRRVIDISGDGPNNMGRAVTNARDHALAQGIIINGLPLMTRDAFSDRWGIDDLDVYYTRCVIGGPGAFVVPVLRWDQFADAVTRKLVLEIAARPAPPPPLNHRAQAYDCLVGEKLWLRNRLDWYTP